jgi:hypothetical protein
MLLCFANEQISRLDAWRAAQPGISPTRSEAIRYLVEIGMTATSPRRPSPRKKEAKK